MQDGRRRRRLASGVAAGLALVGAARAQEDLAAILEAEASLAPEAPTVVTAARYAQRVDRTPSNVYVIDRERIEALEPKTVADLLAVVPGFAVLRRGQRSHQLSAFGVGGQFSNKILVLVDGHRVTEPSFGTVIWQELPVSVEEVTRVEVVLGPESTLYGTNAFAAVVNLLTGGAGEESSRLMVRAGNRGHDHVTHLWRGGEEGARYRAVFEQEHQDGFGALEDAAGTPDPTFVHGETLRRRLGGIRGEVDLPADTRLRFHLSRVDDREGHIPVAPGQRVELDGRSDTTFLAFDLSRAFSLSSGIEVKGRSMRTQRDYTLPPLAVFGVGDQGLDSTLAELELRWRRDTGPWRLVTGFGSRRISLAGYLVQPGDDDAASRSVFVQGEREFGDRFVLFLGARAVFQDLADDEVSWKVAGLYRPRRDTALRLSVGSSFRQPDLVAARFRRADSLGGSPTDRPVLAPNPGIENEQAKEFVQAGFERRWEDGYGKLDLYTARLEGLISLSRTGPAVNTLPGPTPTGVFPQAWENAADPVRVRGATLALEQELGAFRLSLGLNVQDVAGDPMAADAPYAPSRSGSLMLSLPLKERRWGGSLVWTGVGSFDVDEASRNDGLLGQVPGFGLLDLNLERRVSERARVTLSFKNLLDKEHREIPYTLIGDGQEQGVVFGREVFLTVRWDL